MSTFAEVSGEPLINELSQRERLLVQLALQLCRGDALCFNYGGVTGVQSPGCDCVHPRGAAMRGGVCAHERV